MSLQQGTCRQCGNFAHLRCPRCPTVFYCSLVCQAVQAEDHRRTCGKGDDAQVRVFTILPTVICTIEPTTLSRSCGRMDVFLRHNCLPHRFVGVTRKEIFDGTFAPSEHTALHPKGNDIVGTVVYSGTWTHFPETTNYDLIPSPAGRRHPLMYVNRRIGQVIAVGETVFVLIDEDYPILPARLLPVAPLLPPSSSTILPRTEMGQEPSPRVSTFSPLSSSSSSVLQIRGMTPGTCGGLGQSSSNHHNVPPVSGANQYMYRHHSCRAWFDPDPTASVTPTALLSVEEHQQLHHHPLLLESVIEEEKEEQKSSPSLDSTSPYPSIAALHLNS